MIKADFENARVGDRVKCLFFGDGIIREVTNETGLIVTSNLIKVEFDENEESRWYDKDGFCEAIGLCNSLFYDFPDQFPTEEHCKRPLPKIEVDETVGI